MADEPTAPASDEASRQPSPAYRGFLFADLRGYTDFVERQGDSAAARLLGAYRDLVRGVVERHGGAEIKTEGDSFYVVFPSASAAVACALELSRAAASHSAVNPDSPIHVGIGVHAGETVETEEGFVGSAVNVAARVCAQARAGEVLVSEPVRLMTRTSLPVTYLKRGSPRLKGIAEPIALYRVVPTDDPTATLGRSGGWRPGRPTAANIGLLLGALAVAVIAGLGGVVLWAGTPDSPSPSPHGANAQATPTATMVPMTTAPSAAPEVAQSLPCEPFQDGPALRCQLDELPPGRYATTDFDYHIEFTLGPGWRLSYPESPDFVHLSRVDRPGSALEFAVVDQLSRLEPIASPALDDDFRCEVVRTEWDDLTSLDDNLKAQPWLEVGPQVMRNMGGDKLLIQRDVVIRSDSGCGRQGNLVEFFASSDGEPFYNLTGAKLRFLDPGGIPTTYIIVLEAPTEAEFALFEPLAEEVLLSLELPEP